MSDKNHLGLTNTFATQDRWSGKFLAYTILKMVWSGEILISQTKSHSDQMSCKVSTTFMDTDMHDVLDEFIFQPD